MRRGAPARIETGGRRMTLETAAANANYGTTASGSVATPTDTVR